MGASPSPGATTFSNPTYMSIMGTARDGGGKAIVGATVTIYDASTSSVIGTAITSSCGRYTVSLDATEYEVDSSPTPMFNLVITKEGYTTQTITRARQ